MKVFLILLNLVLLSSCVKAKYSVPVELEQYINMFKDEANKRNKYINLDSLKVEYYNNPPNPSVLATCYLDSDSALIRVYTPSWDTLNSVQREILFLHELGHCILYRGHLDTYNAIGHPSSVMNTRILNSLVYEANKEYYLNELFGS